MAFELPFLASYSFDSKFALERVSYNFNYSWSDRNQAFYLTITTNAGDTVQPGIKLLPNTPLLQSTSPFAPTGYLYLRPNGLNLTPPDKDNIGTGLSYSIIYVTKEELDA